MKKIVILMMLLCSITAFAQAAETNYTGNLSITVGDGATDMISGQLVTVVDNGSKVTLSIPNFTYAGYTGTVTIVADKKGTGELDNPVVTFKNLQLFAYFDETSFVTPSCQIHLNIFAVLEFIDVDFISQ